MNDKETQEELNKTILYGDIGVYSIPELVHSLAEVQQSSIIKVKNLEARIDNLEVTMQRLLEELGK